MPKDANQAAALTVKLVTECQKNQPGHYLREMPFRSIWRQSGGRVV